MQTASAEDLLSIKTRVPKYCLRAGVKKTECWMRVCRVHLQSALARRVSEERVEDGIVELSEEIKEVSTSW